MHRRVTGLVFILTLVSCTPASEENDLDVDIDSLARQYLFLELSMGQHDPGHVDAYFGPEELETVAKTAGLSLADIQSGAAILNENLQSIDPSDDKMLAARVAGMQARVQALNTRIAINQGRLRSLT